MLYLIIVDGTLARVVDTPIDLEVAGQPAVQALCRDLGIPLRGLDCQPAQAYPVRPDVVTPWSPEYTGAVVTHGKRRRRFEPPLFKTE